MKFESDGVRRRRGEHFFHIYAVELMAIRRAYKIIKALNDVEFAIYV